MLKHHLNVVCDNVWQQLKDSQHYGINQGEETITDNILLYLARQNLSEIEIFKTPKNLESQKGTDWEWWIGNKNSGFLRYAVQAKKLDSNTKRYTALKHKVGLPPNEEYQHDILEIYANANDAIPLYALYNYIELDDFTPFWKCKLDIDISKFGCTVTSLANIKKAISVPGHRSFKKMHSVYDTIPLRCLAVCPDILSSASRAKKMHTNRTEPLKHLNVEAKVYEDPSGYLRGLGGLNSCNQLPQTFYNHEIGIYPERIMLIKTEE